EREMVRSVGVRRRQCRRTQIAKRLQPLSKDRAHSFVALQVDATNLAGAVVEVVVRRQFVILRPTLNVLRTASLDQTQKTFVLRLVTRRAKMLRDVSLRTKQTLLFTTPQRDPDRAPRLQAQRLNDAYRFHRC